MIIIYFCGSPSPLLRVTLVLQELHFFHKNIMSKVAPESQNKAKSLQPLRSLVPFIAPYKGILAIAIAALLVSSAALLAMPIAVRNVIDQGFSIEDAANVDRYFFILLSMFLCFTKIFQ